MVECQLARIDESSSPSSGANKKIIKQMTKTKIQPKTTGGITKFQINRIMQNCQYNVEIKNEWVQWATGDTSRTSLRSITHDQAIKILLQQTGSSPTPEVGAKENWGLFDKENKQHLTILAQMRTAQWVVLNDKYGEVPDLERLSEFLKSDKSPINKPLKKMEPREVSKIIEAMKGIVKSIYK